MIKGLDLFRECLLHPESYADPTYQSVLEKVVITKTKENSNKLMKSNEKVIDLITTIITTRDDSIDIDISWAIDGIIRELKTSGMNFSPFSQYFMVHNVSYSIFKAMSNEDQKIFIEQIVDKYIKDRHQVYKSHGYSNMTLQVMADNYSHKRKGSIGIKKVSTQLEKRGIKHFSERSSDEEFYIKPDKGDKEKFKDIISKSHIKFEWSSSKQDKLPDILLVINGKIIIIEHKNMKENGGGQDKQIVEIIDFIGYEEDNPKISFMTYLDGIFFNKLAEDNFGKTLAQLTAIEVNLETYKNNFFVNTWGFEKFLDEMGK